MPRRPRATAPRSLSRPASPPLDDAARDRAFLRLADHARRFPELDLRPLDTAGLDGRDAAFAHAITDAAVRRWLTLRHLIALYSRAPFDQMQPGLRAALLGGAVQMFFLDRVPPHAAINHAVEWAKRRVRPAAAAVVNAVLRRLALLLPAPAGEAGADHTGAGTPAHARRERWTFRRDELPLSDGLALPLARPVLPDDDLDRLSVAASIPRPLLEAWSREWPRRQVIDLAHHALADPPIILRTAHARSPLPPEFVAPHSAPGHHVYVGPMSDLAAFLGQRPDVWVQDPASAVAVASVADLSPSLVIDLCAGQGTKTRQLAAVFPNARILATDVDPQRLDTLAGVFAGSPQVAVMTMPDLRRAVLDGPRADLVLLDVPCSNTGVLARRPEARYRFSDRHGRSLLAIQRRIIADALPLVAPSSGSGAAPSAAASRGRILYSTCSLQREENHEQAAGAAREHGFTLDRERLMLPSGGPGRPPAEYSDGSYSVLLA